MDTLKVNVNLVTVGVLVTDSRGREVAGLQSQDFRLLEDGHQQPLSFFSAEKQPVSLVVVVDTSFSMGEKGHKLARVKEAAISLVDSVPPESEFQYFTFHQEIIKKLDFTKDRERVKSVISGTAIEPVGTRIYDALIEVLSQLHRAKYPRQAVVLLTDGVDQHSQHTLEQVIQAVQGTQAEAFMVGIFNAEEDEIFRLSDKGVMLLGGKEVDNPRYSFNRLAEESGAACFFPQSETDISRVVNAISKDLGYQYTLAFYASGTPEDGRFHRIQIEVKRKGVKIRARKGYSLGRLATEP